MINLSSTNLSLINLSSVLSSFSIDLTICLSSLIYHQSCIYHLSSINIFAIYLSTINESIYHVYIIYSCSINVSFIIYLLSNQFVYHQSSQSNHPTVHLSSIIFELKLRMLIYVLSPELKSLGGTQQATSGRQSIGSSHLLWVFFWNECAGLATLNKAEDMYRQHLEPGKYELKLATCQCL